MDENRIQAYLALIQEILRHPGEEQQILDNSADLVDAGFKQMMLVFSADLIGKGQSEEAHRLIEIVKSQLLKNNNKSVEFEINQDEKLIAALNTYLHKINIEQEDNLIVIHEKSKLISRPLGNFFQTTNTNTKFNIYIGPGSEQSPIAGRLYEALDTFSNLDYPQILNEAVIPPDNSNTHDEAGTPPDDSNTHDKSNIPDDDDTVE